MKLKITLKDPDALHDSIRCAVRAEVERIVGLKNDEKGPIEDQRSEDLHEICQEWFQYGEYVQIEIDTEAKTAVVVKVKN